MAKTIPHMASIRLERSKGGKRAWSFRSRNQDRYLLGPAAHMPPVSVAVVDQGMGQEQYGRVKEGFLVHCPVVVLPH